MGEAKLLVLFLLLTNLLAEKHFADSLDQFSATPGEKCVFRVTRAARAYAGLSKMCKVHASTRKLARAWPNTGLDMSDTGSNRKKRILIPKHTKNYEFLDPG